MRQRLLLLLAATTLIAACSGDDGGSSPTAAPNPSSTTAGSDAPVVTDGETTTTLAPAPLLPAGAQLAPDDQAMTIPSGTAVAERDGTFAVFSARQNGVKQCPNGGAVGADCTIEQTDPWVSIGTPGGTFTDVQMDSAGTVPNPSGLGVNTGLQVTAATDGPNGWVAVGAASYWDSLNYYVTSRRGLIWHSTDGTTWQRIDVRDIVGDTSVVMTSVTKTATGYVAVGDIAQPDLSAGPSRGFVLTSPDGITWTKTAELPRQWAVSTSRVIAGDSRIVVHGVEFVCDATAGAMNSFSVGAQFRAWASDDGGVTFSEVSLAGGAVTDPLPPPTDPAACPNMYDEDEAYHSSAGFVALDGDRLVVASADGGSVAVTDDLTTWTVGELPDAIPDLDPAIYTIKTPEVTGIYADDDGLVVVELQALRRKDGRQVDAARQLYSWRSTDNGATWELQPLARPTALSSDEIGTLGHTEAAGFFYLGRTEGQLVIRPSDAGELVAWGECEPAAGADCRFVEVDGLDAAGLDLTGIDLTGASLVNVDLTGTNLSGAVLRGTELFTEEGAVWGGVDLTGADLTKAYLGGMDLAGANLTNAQIVDAYVPGTFVRATLTGATIDNVVVNFTLEENAKNASLAGLTLTDVRFYGAVGGSSMQGVDFSGVTFDDVSFRDIDLTGAIFTGAIFAEGEVVFSSGVICPDGAPATEGVYDHTACRL
jgi:uncharacterized protein YjbI with pentapeptide repeats